MTTEAEMLQRIAGRLGRPAPLTGAEWDSGPSLPPEPPQLAPEDLVQRFTTELEALGGRTFRAGSAAEAAEYVASVAAEEAGAARKAGAVVAGAAGTEAGGAASAGGAGAASAGEAGAAGAGEAAPVLLWDDPLLARLDVAGALARRGLEALAWQPELGAAALRQAADRAPAGVTSAVWGVAETGTIALPAAPGRGRLVSLLPPVHVAVLPRSRIVASVAELFRLLAGAPDLPSSLALATGPSRSADIENDLSIGVHGPARVHVVLLPE